MTPHPTEATRPETVENEDPVCGMAVPADSTNTVATEEGETLF